MKFRFVDKILSWQPQKRICGVKSISFEEYDLKTGLGEESHFPESLLMECLFQLGNWLIMLSSDFTQMGLLLRIQHVQFHDRFRPGQNLLMEVKVRRFRPDGVLFDGKAWVDKEEIATGEGCLALPCELADYYDPQYQRVLFSEIYQPVNSKKEKCHD